MKTLALLFTLFTLASCQRGIDTPTTVEKVNPIETSVVQIESDTGVAVHRPTDMAEAVDSALIISHPDTSMGSIFLGISHDKLTSFVEEKGGYGEPGLDINHSNISAVNPEAGVEAILLFYPGNTEGTPSYIVLRKFQDSLTSRYLHLDEKEFTLSHGAQIGMTQAEFFDRYPKEAFAKSRVEPDRKSYSFRITEESNSPFLYRMNMPEYSAEYLFEDDLLVEVRFGLVMP